MKYNEKDIPLFKSVICPHCNSYELSCKKRSDMKDNHWFLMCPKYFMWVIGLKFDGLTYSIKVPPKRTEF